jgi:hypothetical protein
MMTGRCLALGLLAMTAGFGAAAAELTFDLGIRNYQVPEDMRLIRVHEGDVVRLRCTTDQPLVLHLHGYDIERRVAPGAVTELKFTAYATGRFPIHLHLPRAEAHDDAPLIDVEVYPR